MRASFIKASQRRRRDAGRRLRRTRAAATSSPSSASSTRPRHHRAVGIPKNARTNSVAVMHGGAIVARQAKHHLWNYGVGDEIRNFVAGTRSTSSDRRHRRRAGHLRGPVARRSVGRRSGRPTPRCSSSPTARPTSATRTTSARRWCAAGPPRRARDRLLQPGRRPGRAGLRRRLDGRRRRRRAAGPRAPVRRAAAGRRPRPRRHRLPERRERSAAMTVTRHVSRTRRCAASSRGRGRSSALGDCEEVWRALVAGPADFIDKNGMPSVVLGMSGGIDSALVAAIAVDALGRRPGARRRAAREVVQRALAGRRRGLARRLGLHYSSSRSRRWSTRTRPRWS